MRVLTVGNRFPPHGTGGYERVWQAAVAGLRAAGHDAVVLTTDHRDDAAGTRVEAGVHRELRWHWTPDGFARPGPLATLALERHNAAVLARHARGAGVVVWFGLGGMGLSMVSRVALPQLAVAHDPWPAYGPGADPWTARWGRRSRHRYDPARIAWWSYNSAWLRDGLVARGIDAARTSVDHPGVDPEAFPAGDPPPWRGELLLLGRVEPRKGVATAVAALPAGMRLTVAGPAEPAVRDELGRLGAGRDVVFGGRADDPSAAIAAADALLFPVTWEEPWGLVPLEAMAVGRPVVATGTGGSAEYLRGGENCLLVAPGDAGALRVAVERLRDEPALRARLVAGGRTTAARFTQRAWVDAVVARTERVAAQDEATAR